MARLLPLLLASLACPQLTVAQDIEPRRWTHLPVGTNVVGLTYGYTVGDVLFDPVLEIEDVEVESHTGVATYVRSLDLFGTTGRLDVIVPFQTTRWEGLLSGVPASASREGMVDPWLRMSVNLTGAPALEGEDYLAYRTDHRVNTIVGAAVGVMLPLGAYESDKLLNLGQNRFIVRPQLGVVHSRGPWAYELTGSVFLFTDNDDFFGGNKLEQDPLLAVQGHVIHTLPSRMWFSASVSYGWGGEARINGVHRKDQRSNLLAGLSVGFPVGASQALKFGYVRGDTQRRVGTDTDSLFLSWTFRF